MANFAYGDAGLALTKNFEGCVLTAYADQGGVWTIGYGHTGPGVHAGWRAMLPGRWLALIGW
jgi:lysozyme